MKRKYSYKEKRAYFMGKGAAIGFGRASQIKKVTSRMTKEEKESFYNGFDEYSSTKRI